MIEEMLSAEAQLAVISYNEALLELRRYFDKFDNVENLLLRRLEAPEGYHEYSLPFAGNWKKYGKEGDLAVRFNCVQRGSIYHMQIELNGFEHKGEVVSALNEAQFTLTNNGHYSSRKAVIELDLVN